MNSYRVTFRLDDDEEHVVIIQAETTGQVFGILEEQEPDATEIKIEQIND